ncbi:hypothetical protein VitviT2T_029564 [Vitis vinifera]|uniref:Non-canonical poly(A) RNA polymerase PAPD5 n=1 Tax=Vitis vinifera TaxID=29760 RepID=A0ABY9DZ02_VITVI|nr:hypothetical protein VitviT2T_029564 [Vitis vinifera]
METASYFYETLSPLSPPPSDRSPPPSDESQPYYVYRNQISLSSLSYPSPETAAPDYFSLDARADVEEPSPARFRTPPPASEEEAPAVESGWFRGNSRLRSPMLKLHKEILDFSDFLSPTPKEQSARNAAIESVFNVIRYIWPNCKVEVFGSFKTGLYLPTSDIDVVILGSDIKTPQIGLYALSRALSQKGIAKKIQVIAKARVPIIKFIEKRSSVAFDISFDVENGPKAAEYIQDAISKWPPLRPLCLILKVFLQQRELNEVYSGGIGSYALLAMLIAMLQNLQEWNASVEHNLGVLLVNFFDFYGRKLNTVDIGVTCNGPGTFFLKSTKGFVNKGQKFLISIEDPQLPGNDIGKNSFNYFQIRSAFSMAFSTLTNARTILGLDPNRSILGEPLSPQTGGQELLCNWQVEDAEEEPLPRSNPIAGDGSANSSGKKRKASKERLRNKVKEHADMEKDKSQRGMICRERNPSGIGTDQKDSKPHTRLCFLGRFLQNWKT